MKLSCYKLFVGLSVTCVCVVSYNLDVKSAIMYEDPNGHNQARASYLHNKTRGSYFGFSVALVNGTSSGSWLFVGSPRGNSTAHEDIFEPGVLYKCLITPLQHNQTCEMYILDDTGNEESPDGAGIHYHDRKDGAWVGAAMDIHSSGDDAELTICGHRWINMVKQGKNLHFFALGICYVVYAKDIPKVGERNPEGVKLIFVPTDDMIFRPNPQHTGFYYGMAQAGMSVHYAEPQEGTVLVAGAPGILSWQGGVMYSKRKIQKDSVPQQRRRRDVSWEYEGKPHNVTFILQKVSKYYDYFGYQVTSGNFFHNLYSYAASSPRGDDLNGNVQFYSVLPKNRIRITNSAKVHGTQPGEYFGASIAVADVNGDNFQDLIVGAPTYHKQCEEGRIYIFHGGNKKQIFEKKNPIDGYTERSRFGTAVLSLGDIDQDGYEDIAVGAPYEGRGTVYIFNGSPPGLRKDYSQRISATEISPYLMGFGISISKPADIDKNDYGDIAVGSFLSGNVVLLRSHPVVKLRMLLTSKSNYLLLSDTNFTVELHLWFEGQHVDEIDVGYTVTVDVKHKRCYFAFGQGRGNTYQENLVKLKNGKNYTNEIVVHVDGNNSGQETLLEPIELIMAADLYRKKNGTEEVNGDDFEKLVPIIHNYDSAKSYSLLVPLSLDCGKKTCKCDLKVSALLESLSNGGVFVTGSSDSLDLKIYVENEGDPAYLTTVCIMLPYPVQLNKIPQDCFEPQTSGMSNSINITCDIAYLMRRGMNISLTVPLDMTTVTHDFNLSISVTSPIEDYNEKNNLVSLTVKLVTEADVTIAGKDEKGEHVYNGQYPETSKLHHKYEVQKFKQSSVDEVEVILHVPWLFHVEGLQKPLKLVDVYEPEATQNYKKSSEKLSCESNIPYKQYTVDDDEILETNHSTNTSIGESSQGTQTPSIPISSHLYLNCSVSNIECGYIKCLTRPFTNNHTIARITLTMTINIANLVTYLGKNGVIIYSTDGSVNITKPDILNESNILTDYAEVSTAFYLYAPKEKVKVKIIILAVAGGLLLLLLLVLGLVKAGFFRRKKKEELQSLIAENEATSSSVQDKCGTNVAVNG